MHRLYEMRLDREETEGGRKTSVGVLDRQTAADRQADRWDVGGPLTPLSAPSSVCFTAVGVGPEQRHGARSRNRTATRRRRGEERGPWAPLRPPTGLFTWTWTAGFRRYDAYTVRRLCDDNISDKK